MRLASYKLEDVTHIWFTQWKNNRDDFAFCNSLYSSPIQCQSRNSLRTFSVSTPVGDQVIARRVYRNCPVIVSQNVTSADLVELEMVDFDVILGMDWLHSCYASVNCITTIVRFQFPDEPILEWKGSILAPMGRFISYLKDRKMISKGYLYHLLWVKDSSLSLKPQLLSQF